MPGRRTVSAAWCLNLEWIVLLMDRIRCSKRQKLPPATKRHSQICCHSYEVVSSETFCSLLRCRFVTAFGLWNFRVAQLLVAAMLFLTAKLFCRWVMIIIFVENQRTHTHGSQRHVCERRTNFHLISLTWAQQLTDAVVPISRNHSFIIFINNFIITVFHLLFISFNHSIRTMKSKKKQQNRRMAAKAAKIEMKKMVAETTLTSENVYVSLCYPTSISWMRYEYEFTFFFFVCNRQAYETHRIFVCIFPVLMNAIKKRG